MQHQPTSELPTMTRSKAWLYAAAGLSVAAGLLHLLVMPEHFEEWPGYGLFFLIVALAQLVYAVLLLRRPASRTLLVAGIVGNVLIVGFWAFTRTVGVPFGPEAGEVEAIGMVDTVSKLVELALICCLFILLRNSAHEG
ncbi:MAG TPA: hypothetical protein PKM78_01240 [Anaerolineae bacterium]|nr:hypothetical protein [Anaerolineae bacterium]HNU03275.1 hypothetical protein [Anaerolineae bacterium]